MENRFIRSKLGDTKNVGPSRLSYQSIPLVNVRNIDDQARTWIVTLGKVKRIDNKFSIEHNNDSYGSEKLFPFASGNENFSCGTQLGPFFPPLRTNPVSVSGSQSYTPRVTLKWSMNVAGSGESNNLVADWPMQGSSFVITAASLDVGALAGTPGSSSTPPFDGGSFTASIAPFNGNSNIEFNKLTLSQYLFFGNQGLSISAANYDRGGLVAYVPDFARQVKVALASSYYGGPIPSQYASWANKNSQCAVNFYNDAGQIVDSYYYDSTVVPNSGVWLDVPAQATMIGTYRISMSDVSNNTVYLNWRISP